MWCPALQSIGVLSSIPALLGSEEEQTRISPWHEGMEITAVALWTFKHCLEVGDHPWLAGMSHCPLPSLPLNL